MKQIQFPYGKTKLTYSFEEDALAGVLLRVLERARVVYISDMPDDFVEKMHMTPAHSLDEALTIAKKLLQKENIKIAAIPDGVSVIVRK